MAQSRVVEQFRQNVGDMRDFVIDWQGSENSLVHAKHRRLDHSDVNAARRKPVNYPLCQDLFLPVRLSLWSVAVECWGKPNAKVRLFRFMLFRIQKFHGDVAHALHTARLALCLQRA